AARANARQRRRERFMRILVSSGSQCRRSSAPARGGADAAGAVSEVDTEAARGGVGVVRAASGARGCVAGVVDGGDASDASGPSVGAATGASRIPGAVVRFAGAGAFAVGVAGIAGACVAAGGRSGAWSGGAAYARRTDCGIARASGQRTSFLDARARSIVSA